MSVISAYLPNFLRNTYITGSENANNHTLIQRENSDIKNRLMDFLGAEDSAIKLNDAQKAAAVADHLNTLLGLKNALMNDSSPELELENLKSFCTCIDTIKENISINDDYNVIKEVFNILLKLDSQITLEQIQKISDLLCDDQTYQTEEQEISAQLMATGTDLRLYHTSKTMGSASATLTSEIKKIFSN